jgi:exonuclease SbcC
MAERPLQGIEIAEFRGLTGTRIIPLDAPVVLIHGANGAGKTSILSALEFGLTGHVHSMERTDPNYLAHLPNVEKPFATVRVTVADSLRSGSAPERMVVAGPTITGSHALNDDAAMFYRERCYLDQASLGRLLDIYQHTEAKEESALARFVNELLGLHDIDALLEGLQPANNLANLKKLAERLKDADSAKKEAEEALKRFTAARSDEQRNLQEARQGVVSALNAASVDTTDAGDDALLQLVAGLDGPHDGANRRASIESIHRELLALGGRITALAAQPTNHKLVAAKAAAADSAAAYDAWRSTYQQTVDLWRRRAEASTVRTNGDFADALRAEMDTTRKAISNQTALRAQANDAEANLGHDRASLTDLEHQYADAQQHASTLVEGLATIRPLIDSDACPVCDRDFGTLGEGSLGEHVDQKMRRLSVHGQELLQLRTRRDDAAKAVATAEANLSRLELKLLDEGAFAENRLTDLQELQQAFAAVASVIADGDALRRRADDAAVLVETLEAAATESAFIDNELNRFATQLNVASRVGDEQQRPRWQRLFDAASGALDSIERTDAARREAASSAARLRGALERDRAAARQVLAAAQDASEHAAAIVEGQRRQAVAKKVHEAATKARAAIVQDVFTESLNNVWADVFTRLAPNERFIPAFAAPVSTKNGMTVNLETRDRAGNKAGTPQMMLSAGNLNTAALSLFLALHLAVEPTIKCLVFDDPVQAMDEVHIAQFAALIRGLAKQHGRQVIVAVHERELFDYLALELSPAYDGDELITIELVERATDKDEGITRHAWTPDPAVAS